MEAYYDQIERFVPFSEFLCCRCMNLRSVTRLFLCGGAQQAYVVLEKEGGLIEVLCRWRLTLCDWSRAVKENILNCLLQLLFG